MKRRLLIGLTIFLLSFTSAQEVTLRMGYFLPATSTVPRAFLEPWAQKVMADSNGRIKIETFPSSQLAPPAATYDAIKDGIMDLGWGLPGYTPGRFPLSEVFELPFMASSAEVTSQAAWDFFEAHLQEEFSDVHMIAFHVHSPGLFHVKGEPITNLQDLQGRTIRAPTRAMNEALALMGAEPVGMPVPQVPEAISRGVIDATVLPYQVTIALKLAELVDSHTSFEGDRSLYTATFFFAMNKESYENLPDDLKAIIDANTGRAFSAQAGRAMDEDDAVGLELAQTNGNAFFTFSEEDRETWLATTQAVTDNWIAATNEAGLDGEALIQEVENLILKYENE